MPSSSSSQSSESSGQVVPFYLFDGYGYIYLCEPDINRADTVFRIAGPGQGVVSGLAVWEIKRDTIPPVTDTYFCALKKNNDGSACFMYRDKDGGYIADFTVDIDPGWGGIIPWPGRTTTMVAPTRNGLSLIEVSTGAVVSTEISQGRRIYYMAPVSGTDTSMTVCCFAEFGEPGRKIMNVSIGREPFTYYDYTEEIKVEHPAPNIGGVVFADDLIMTVNSDMDGGVNVVSYKDDMRVYPRLPISARGAAYPVLPGDTLPYNSLQNIEATTRVHNSDSSVNTATGTVFFSTAVPGGTSSTSVISLKVEGVKRISNVRLGLVEATNSLNPSGTYLVDSSPSFDPSIVPVDFFQGINLAEDPDSLLNIEVGVRQETPDSRPVESDYVYLAAKMPAHAIGIIQCRYKWFFDYEPDPYAPVPESSSSSSSSTSSSSPSVS